MNLQHNNKVLLIQSANKAVYQQQRSRLKNINTYMLRKTSQCWPNLNFLQNFESIKLSKYNTVHKLMLLIKNIIGHEGVIMITDMYDCEHMTDAWCFYQIDGSNLIDSA